MSPHLYKSACPSVGNAFVKIAEIRLSIVSERGGRCKENVGSNKEEGETRRKERRGGRSDEEERVTRKEQ